MKFRKITFKDHPILGDCEFDFTNDNGETIDTIILAGENGCGKTTLLNNLFELSPHMKNHNFSACYEVDLSPEEINTFNLQNHCELEINRINIIANKDETIKYLVGDVVYNEYSFFVPKEGWYEFKRILSDVEINFTSNPIESVKSSNIDQDNANVLKSNNSLATEITQLLVDIKSLDDSELADWIIEHPGQLPPDELKQRRMKRFTNAFHSVFEHKRFKGIANKENHKIINFEEHGKIIPIDQLSSGEKQIVFRGGFLLKNQKSTEGAYVLIDEPELSLHPKWQLKILPFIKGLFTDNNREQKSQIIIATHSPFIIHNYNRFNDKVIVLEKDEFGKIKVSSNPEFYSWTPMELVKNAFNINFNLADEGITVFVEGITDEKYFKKAMEIFGFDKNLIHFEWIGRDTIKGPQNTGDKALNSAYAFLTANPQIIKSTTIFLFDCDTNRKEEDDRMLHIRLMKKNEANSHYKKGIENLLILQDDFVYDKFYDKKTISDDYGGITTTQQINKQKLCDYLCSLEQEKLKGIFVNLKTEIDRILSIKE